MNHHHRKSLHALFEHPASANLDPKHVLAAIEALGGTIDRGGHGHLKITIHGHTHGFHDSHHSLSKQEVVELRNFLTAAGVDPARDFPL